MDACTLDARAERLGLTFAEAVEIMAEPAPRIVTGASKAADPFATAEAEAAELPF